MKQGIYEILENEPIAPGIMRLVLEGDTAALTAPGQFVNIELPGRFLRRPFSVCLWDRETLTVVYKIVGGGTEELAGLPAGSARSALRPRQRLRCARAGDRPCLSAAGSAPLPCSGSASPVGRVRADGPARLQHKSEVILEDEFRALGPCVSPR
jgi:dihydroorotate dehydrogenase electron transfer subunit